VLGGCKVVEEHKCSTTTVVCQIANCLEGATTAVEKNCLVGATAAVEQ